MKTRKTSIIISAVITFLATIIIATFCINDWVGITPWAFGMILWSEIVFFGGLILLENVSKGTEQLISRSVISTLLSCYLIANVCSSIVFIAFFNEYTEVFVVLEVLFFVILAIGVVVALAASKGVYESNERTMQTVSTVEGMISRLNKLSMTPQCEPYSATLKKLYEDLRFTDVSVNVPVDEEIEQAISTIEIEISGKDELDDEMLKSTMVRLNSLIEKRKVETKDCKKGSI